MSLDLANSERMYADLGNIWAQIGQNGVKTGCVVSESTPQAMSVDVASGTVIIQGTEVTVSSATGLSISASDPSNPRLDLIRVDATGTIDVVTGTPASDPKPDVSFDFADYAILARVRVEATETSIVDAKIKDLRVLINAAPPPPSSGIDVHVESFTSQTSVVANHGFNNSNVIVQVYDSSDEQITPNTIDITDANNVTVNFSSATTGKIIIYASDTSVANTGVTAYYSQGFTSSTSVAVSHSLGQKYPVVKCYDSSDQEIEPATITAVDDNNLTVTFSPAQTGKVVVVGGVLSTSVYGVKRYSESFTGETTGYTVAHNLNTTTPDVTVYDNTGVLVTPSNITVTDANTVTIDFALSTSGNVEVQGGSQSTSPGSGTADFLPDTNNTWDIGSGTFKWKDLYAVRTRTGTIDNSGSDITVDDNLDMNGNEVKGMVMEILSSDPGSPVEGQVWYNSTDKQLKLYNGTSVVILG